MVTGPAGTLKLTELNWVRASAGWGRTQKNRTVDGRPLTLDEKPVEGIGTHSVSIIEFEIPEGYDTFTSKGVITEGSQGRGSIQFSCPGRSRQAGQAPAEQSIGILCGPRDHGQGQSTRLWARRDLGEFSGSFEQELGLHGAGLFRISPTP